MQHGVVRPAAVADVAAMLGIYAPIVQKTAISFEVDPPTEKEFAERLRRITETDPWLVFDADGDIVGYAYSSPFKARPAYARTRETTVYVGDRHRSQRIGRRLLGSVLDELTARGNHHALAFITLPNEPSARLHEGLDFTRAGTLHEVGYKLGRWHDVGIWERALDSQT